MFGNKEIRRLLPLSDRSGGAFLLMRRNEPAPPGPARPTPRWQGHATAAVSSISIMTPGGTLLPLTVRGVRPRPATRGVRVRSPSGPVRPGPRARYYAIPRYARLPAPPFFARPG